MGEGSLDYNAAAAKFQLLAHAARLHILDELRRGAACVCHLQAVLDRPQAYVSQQLRVLREAEVVSDEKEGLNVYYRVTDGGILQLLAEVFGPPQAPRQVADCPCPKCTSEETCCDT
jgi:ArsR family transcriptional regulator